LPQPTVSTLDRSAASEDTSAPDTSRGSFPYRRLVVILIRPSKYDDDGYVIRHLRGTLPSNTLACLNSLTEDAVRHGGLEGLEVHVEVLDEIVTRIDPRKLGRKFRRADTKVVVGLVGVQSNQFPRAQDLARQFRAERCDVMIGGFHVSGAIAMSPTMPADCQEMLDAGVTLVLGEVEDRWPGLLRDAAMNRLRPLYDFLGERPDLTDKPLPRASLATQKKFAMAKSGTIDAGRGCPFNCSFCAIINVQGRSMRCRSAEQILRQVRENYHLDGRQAGVRHYFFTDDNFARNPVWEAIFDGLIAMREQEDIAIDFMMQVDTQARRIPNFVEKAARAGCVQVFIGLEAMRDDNLAAGGKPQNRSAQYREMIAHWHQFGVLCHVGYIIGFPYDTYERVMEDVRAMREDLGIDQASFFMLTPIPGSRDHRAAVDAGVPLDPDLNRYDSFHATMPHPRMSPEEWERAFRDAWTTFYSFEYMRQSLLRQNPHTYWGMLKNLIWYRAAMAEGAHPMVTGFLRLKDRKSRRPTLPVEGRWVFFRRRFRDLAHIGREYFKIFLVMQELWLKTRIRRDEYAFLGDLRRMAAQGSQEVKVQWAYVHTVMAERLGAMRGSIGAQRTQIGQVMRERLEVVRAGVGARTAALKASVGEHTDRTARNLGARAASFQAALSDLRLKYLPPVAEPSLARRLARRLNVFSMQRAEARGSLTLYWQQTWHAMRSFRLWRVNPVTLTVNIARDTRHALIFFFALLSERY
jgi:radical SAM superfamily enzyme YgiQ (UPF0313 family)